MRSQKSRIAAGVKPARRMREYRGSLTKPGKESPDRHRSIAENLDLFTRMRAGEFSDGQYLLRAKIDMAASNINMRDMRGSSQPLTCPSTTS
jgi:glutamyl/glutaminyl-tRNA synthetase